MQVFRCIFVTHIFIENKKILFQINNIFEANRIIMS